MSVKRLQKSMAPHIKKTIKSGHGKHLKSPLAAGKLKNPWGNLKALKAKKH